MNKKGNSVWLDIIMNHAQDGTPSLKQKLVDDSPIAMYTCDAEGYVTFYNQAAAELWGRKPEIGKDLWCGSWKIYYPDGSPMPISECPMAQALKDGSYFQQADIVIERPDHTFRSLLVFPRAIYSPEGKLLGAHNTLVDVSYRELAETRDAFLSAIVQSSDDAIITKNLDGIITSWNEGAEQIFGYEASEVVGKPITILIPPSRLTEEDTILSMIRNGQKVDHYQTIRVDKYGNEIPISLTVSPVKDGAGKIIGASKIARNISSEIKSRQEILQYTNYLESINQIGKKVFAKLDIKNILQYVVGASAQLIRASYGAIFYHSINGESVPTLHYALFGAAPALLESSSLLPQDPLIWEAIFIGKRIMRSDDITKLRTLNSNQAYLDMLMSYLPIVSTMAAPIFSAEKRVVGGLFFGHPAAGQFTRYHEKLLDNITAQTTIALANAELFQEVKALSYRKDEFIALASHELKTPLTSIYGYLQYIEKNPDNQLTRYFIEKCLSQTQKLNKLISELLDVSKIEAGKLQFNMEAFDIGQLLREVIETFRYTNNSHHIQFEQAADRLIVEADKQRIEQVVLNLLSNAVKYSPNARQIDVSLEKTPKLVTVRVTDHGLGLKPEDQQKIFSRFYRADSHSKISGLGLGLFLSKEIIERHGGTIGLKSEYGKGSQFYFNLPL